MGEVAIIGVDLAKNMFQLNWAAADQSVPSQRCSCRDLVDKQKQ